MSAITETILADLASVDHERRARVADPALGRAVDAVKAYQQRRFAHTYADLLARGSGRDAAARFFLDELYGPRDFTRRDAQFARVVPTLVRLFPHELVDTLASLAALHALSEALDSAMGRAIDAPDRIDAPAYQRAWVAAGRAADRERQIALTLAVGHELSRLTRKAWLRHSLRLMRGAAHAAGLGALQEFLESGFDTFGALRDPASFLALIGQRERALAAALFAHPPERPLPCDGVFGQLP